MTMNFDPSGDTARPVPNMTDIPDMTNVSSTSSASSTADASFEALFDTSSPSSASAAVCATDTLHALLRAQRAAWQRAPYPPWEARAHHLKALRALLLDNRDALAEAINADFGQRAKAEIMLAEFVLARQEIDVALKYGPRWMKPQRRRTGKWLLPGKSWVIAQPLGVAGIIVPWNYPVLLAAGPLVCALAAGNHALIKMSEFTPRTSTLFAELIGKTFAREHVAVVNGDAAVGAAFAALPFDHLLFTGSTRVGHEIMRAAAANLTPVTLELGGKSPAIIAPDMRGARFDYAVDSLLAGKTLNAGQTCIAPDYVLLPRGLEDAFIARARQRIARLYPDFHHNRDYTSIISTHHFARLQRLASDAQAAGAQLHPLVDFQHNTKENTLNDDARNTPGAHHATNVHNDTDTRDARSAHRTANAHAAHDIHNDTGTRNAHSAQRADNAIDARNTRRFTPTLVTDAPAHTALMQEEIFGPLLPLVPYDTLDNALRYVNERPRPLALYLYTDDSGTIKRVTRETVAGGMAINETLMHIASEGLPFGGVGASGMGAYHGYEGFATFSKMKPVFQQSRVNARALIAPPYGRLFAQLMRVMLGR